MTADAAVPLMPLWVNKATDEVEGPHGITGFRDTQV